MSDIARLPADEARRRMAAALAETGFGHIGAALLIGPCTVCGMTCLKIDGRLGLQLTDAEHAMLEQAAQVAWPDGDVRYVPPLQATRATCECADAFTEAAR